MSTAYSGRIVINATPARIMPYAMCLSAASAPQDKRNPEKSGREDRHAEDRRFNDWAKSPFNHSQGQGRERGKRCYRNEDQKALQRRTLRSGKGVPTAFRIHVRSLPAWRPSASSAAHRAARLRVGIAIPGSE